MSEQVELASLLGDESNPIEFPKGLIGLEEWHRFVIVSHPAGGSLKLLQSLEDDRVSFIVADPYQVVSDYQLNLSPADIEALGLEKNSAELDVCCIISVQEEPLTVTANLLGPLVINKATGVGLQVILAESSYSARHLLSEPPNATTPTVLAKPEEEV